MAYYGRKPVVKAEDGAGGAYKIPIVDTKTSPEERRRKHRAKVRKGKGQDIARGVR